MPYFGFLYPHVRSVQTMIQSGLFEAYRYDIQKQARSKKKSKKTISQNSQKEDYYIFLVENKSEKVYVCNFR